MNSEGTKKESKMLDICPYCGAVNKVKQPKNSIPTLEVTCRKCGRRHILEIGTTSQSMAMIRCPVCGYTQAPAERCAKCGASLVRMEKPEDFNVSEEVKPGLISKRYKTFIVIAIVMIIIIFSGSIASVFFMLTRSDAYKSSKNFIKNSREIRAVVGNNMRFGLVTLGFVKMSGREGTAKFKIRVRGSKGSTEVRVFLRKTADEWRVVAASYKDRYGVMRRLPLKDQVPGASGNILFGKSKLTVS
jgi:DNA-directed RNA polymerase subunit RPC12/RpoP